MIEWREEFSIGIEKIDSQHKEFLIRLNHFLKNLKEGKGDEELLKTFNFLEEYALFHFEAEENFMKEMDFKDFSQHKKMHDNFKEEIKNMKEKIKKEGVTLDFKLKLSKKLTDWYINHIGKADKKYAELFKNIKT